MPPQIQAGASLGRYELLVELGRGAMGAVYKARDPQLDRLVAIKTVFNLGQDVDEELVYRQRFFLEARAAARLSHPGIVQVFDAGEETETGTPYIVMEFVAGEALSGKLAGNAKLPTPMALRLAQEIAEALAYAHSQGVIHRDIKPANILIANDGHAKITDFGVAKLDFWNSTLPGHLVGTPAYMAPELLTGATADGRSDLFSLGVVFYSMLTGHRPFQGNSPGTIRFKVINKGPVPVSSFDLEISPEMDYVVSRALAKDPAERYETGSAMALDILDLRNEQEPRSRSGIRTTATTTSTIACPAETAVAACVPDAIEPDTTSANQKSQPVRAIAILRRVPRKIYAASLAAFIAVALLLALWEVHTTPNAVQDPVAGAGAAHDNASTHPTAASREKTARKRTEQPAETATLQLEIQHPFQQARLWVFIDDRLASSALLRSGANGRLRLFQRKPSKVPSALQVPAGEHRLRVRIQSEDGSYDQTQNVVGNFKARGTQLLHIKCDKHRLQLKLK